MRKHLLPRLPPPYRFILYVNVNMELMNQAGRHIRSLCRLTGRLKFQDAAKVPVCPRGFTTCGRGQSKNRPRRHIAPFNLGLFSADPAARVRHLRQRWWWWGHPSSQEAGGEGSVWNPPPPPQWQPDMTSLINVCLQRRRRQDFGVAGPDHLKWILP